MTAINRIVGNNLRQFRERLGLSQEALADYLHITHASISYYENGQRSIPTDIVNRAASLFGIDGYDLYEEDAAHHQSNVAFAFRADQLTVEDLNEIARFRSVVRNYIKMKKIVDREAQKDK